MRPLRGRINFNASALTLLYLCGMLNVSPLPESEKQTLEEYLSNGSKKHLRNRCQCILLNNKGLNVKILSDIFETRTRTIYTWIHQYDKFGFLGLTIKPGRGVKSKLINLDLTQIADICEEVRLNPQNLQSVSAILSEKFGFEVSKAMLKKYLKKN